MKELFVRIHPGGQHRRVVRDAMEVTIHGLAGGGDGIARLPTDSGGGGVVFVPDTAPGDLVRVEVPSGPRAWRRGRLLEVRRPGPGRREPRCQLALRCGGCQWHHLTEETQREAKQEILARALRQARIAWEPAPLVPAPRSLSYRSRARLRWETDRRGRVRIGFRARRSHALVEAEGCPVLVASLDAVLPRLGPHLPVGGRGELLLLGAPDGAVAATLRGPDLPPGAAARLGDALEGALDAVAVTTGEGQVVEQWGASSLNLALAGEAPFLAAPHAFSQANLEVNRILRRRVAEWAAEALAEVGHERSSTRGSRVVELYAGSGNLTRDLAALGPVLAVESAGDGVALGKRNLAGREVTWREEDASLALVGIEPAEAPLLVVLDPPRVGARELMGPLGRLAPPVILYVSCDPMTLARDVADLAGSGYTLARVEALDTLPQTSHFEIVAELRRPC